MKHLFSVPTVLASIAFLAPTNIQAATGRDSPPTPIVRIDAVYPSDLVEGPMTGDATVEFVVDTTGRVAAVKVVHATHESFGRSAAECVAKWKFRPGVHNGKKANCRMRQSMHFEPPPLKKRNIIVP